MRLQNNNNNDEQTNKLTLKNQYINENIMKTNTES
jgi:hypothetical protein